MTLRRLLGFAGTLSLLVSTGCEHDMADPIESNESIASVSPPTELAPGSAAARPIAVSADASSSRPEPATDAGPTIVPTLDAKAGSRALLDYRAALALRCASDAPMESIPELGVPDKTFLCADPRSAGEAIASGAFSVPGADEVLLEVPSGLDGAAGDRALMLMRRRGATYRMMRQLTIGRGFGAIARLTTSSTDVLLICEKRGSMGLYPTTCGFLGAGSFSPAGPGGTTNEIELVTWLTCGKSASVEMGRPFVDADRLLHVPLAIEEAVREPAPSDVDGLCSRRTVTRTKAVAVLYRVEAGRAVRVTAPLPEVDRIVRSY